MLSHGHRKRRLLVAAAVALLLLVVFAKLPNGTQFHHVLHKTGHPVAFALLAVIVAHLLASSASGRHVSRSRMYALAFATAVALGAVTELAQIFLNRGSSLLDVLRDAVGATAGLSIFSLRTAASQLRVNSKGGRATALSLAVGASLIAVVPLLWCIAAYVNRDLRFPVLAEFESALDTYFVEETNPVALMDLPQAWARQPDETALRIAFHPKGSRGAGLREPSPDWSGYDELAVEVTNPMPTELGLIIRVHDHDHNWEHEDRFNRRVHLAGHTRTVFRIPLREISISPEGRRMDMKRIAGIAVFVPRGGMAEGAFFLNRIWLERAPH